MSIMPHDFEEDDVDFMDVISEAYGDDEDDYLDRLGASEPSVSEDTEVIEETVIDPETFERVVRTIERPRGTTLRRGGGQAIQNINANRFTANENMTIQNGHGAIASISATDINHPVIDEMKDTMILMARKIDELEARAKSRDEAITDVVRAIDKRFDSISEFSLDMAKDVDKAFSKVKDVINDLKGEINEIRRCGR